MHLAFDDQNLWGCMGAQSLLSRKACCEVTETSPKGVCHSISRIQELQWLALCAILLSSASLSLTPPFLFFCHVSVCLSLLSHFLLISLCSSFLYHHLYSSSFSFDMTHSVVTPVLSLPHPPSAQLLRLTDHNVSR